MHHWAKGCPSSKWRTSDVQQGLNSLRLCVFKWKCTMQLSKRCASNARRGFNVVQLSVFLRGYITYNWASDEQQLNKLCTSDAHSKGLNVWRLSEVLNGERPMQLSRRWQMMRICWASDEQQRRFWSLLQVLFNREQDPQLSVGSATSKLRCTMFLMSLRAPPASMLLGIRAEKGPDSCLTTSLPPSSPFKDSMLVHSSPPHSEKSCQWTGRCHPTIMACGHC